MNLILILYRIKNVFKRTSRAQKTFYIIGLFPLIVKTSWPLFLKKIKYFIRKFVRDGKRAASRERASERWKGEASSPSPLPLQVDYFPSNWYSCANQAKEARDMIWPKSQFENPPGSGFCNRCGTQISPSTDMPYSQRETIQQPTEELTVGSTFAGRYQIIEELGREVIHKTFGIEDKKGMPVRRCNQLGIDKRGWWMENHKRKCGPQRQEIDSQHNKEVPWETGLMEN